MSLGWSSSHRARTSANELSAEAESDRDPATHANAAEAHREAARIYGELVEAREFTRDERPEALELVKEHLSKAKWHDVRAMDLSKRRNIVEGPGSKQSLRELFSMGNDPPIKPVEPGPIVTPERRWKVVADRQLRKTFVFQDLARRNSFLTQCLSWEESNPSAKLIWGVDGESVEVCVESDAIGLTEVEMDVARTLDSVARDIALG